MAYVSCPVFRLNASCGIHYHVGVRRTLCKIRVNTAVGDLYSISPVALLLIGIRHMSSWKSLHSQAIPQFTADIHHRHSPAQRNNITRKWSVLSLTTACSLTYIMYIYVPRSHYGRAKSRRIYPRRIRSFGRPNWKDWRPAAHAASWLVKISSLCAYVRVASIHNERFQTRKARTSMMGALL